MDYITSELDKKIRFLADAGQRHELANYHRAKIEYGLLFLVGYLWNKNLARLEPDQREIVLNRLLQPTVGALVDISRILDLDSEVFGAKALSKVINKYPQLRNEKIGHGYVFADGLDESIKAFTEISEVMFTTANTLLALNCDLVLVQRQINNTYVGINFKSSGAEYTIWRCPIESGQFEVGSIYCYVQNQYYRLSPFVGIQEDQQFYIFRDVQDRLTGKVRYNQLFHTNMISREWPSLMTSVSAGDTRTRTINGTIINNFRLNYRRYIDIGIRKQLTEFLVSNRSSVCATVWGHGGVGKTATVQAICEELGSRPLRAFDYIVFASAKDRYYDYYTGSIKSITEKTIDSYESLLRCINGAIGSDAADSIDSIINFTGRLLIIIDDMETFADQDKRKIEELIKRLDINKHKVLLTTRANIVIGLEYQSNELGIDETIEFILQVLATEFPDSSLTQAEKQLEDPIIRKLVQDVTSGRPLFIFQLALIWAQQGTLRDALKRNIKAEDSAIEFLYGRIYDYLSNDAKKLFITISQLVSKSDPSNLLEKLQYVTSFENDESAFQTALKELLKLRLVEILENKFFRVYSNEILRIMASYFERSPSGIRGGIVGRIQQVTRDKKLDNEHALLETANSARFAKSEEEAVSQYRQILNRTSCPLDVKLAALLNLADFLFNHRGKKENAVMVIGEFRHLFPSEPSLAKVYANYLWSLDRRDEAIATLSEFFSRKPNFDGDLQKRIELTGLYVTYASIAVVERKEELKAAKRYGEITTIELMNQYDGLKREMVRIFGIGWKLFLVAKSKKVTELRPASRQNVATALVQLVNVALRLNKFNEAISICEFGIQYTSGLYPETFRLKRDYALRTRSRDEMRGVDSY